MYIYIYIYVYIYIYILTYMPIGIGYWLLLFDLSLRSQKTCIEKLV